MNTFSQRNVFDRLETAFSLIFSTHWRRNLSPFLVIMAIDIVIALVALLGGGVFLMIVGGTLLSIGLSGWMLGGAFILGVFSLVLVAYWITSNLVFSTVMTLIRRGSDDFSTMEILSEGWKLTKRALRFDGYYYTILALVLAIPTIFSIVRYMSLLPSMIEGSMSRDEMIGQVFSGMGYFVLFALGYLIFSWWFSVRYATSKPGFLLGEMRYQVEKAHTEEALGLEKSRVFPQYDESRNFSTFLAGSYITSNHFWMILGNLLVLSITLMLVSGIAKSLLGGFFDPWSGVFSTLQTDSSESVRASLLPALSQFSFLSGFGSILLSLSISMLTSIFRASFSYVLWEELLTEKENLDS